MATIQKYMASPIWSIAGDTFIPEAAKKMKEYGVGSLLIMKGKEYVGIVTRTDMTNKVIAEGINPASHRIESIMASPLFSIDAHASMEDADRMMNEKKVRHLLVKKGGSIVGIVSSRDLVWNVVQEKTENPVKRGYVRLPFTALVKYKDAGKKEYHTLTYDINGGGLFIQTRDPLPIGSEISIEMALPKGEEIIRSKGIVAWLRKTPMEVMKATAKIVYVRKQQQKVIVHPGGMGVKFTDISEKGRLAIIEFVTEMMPKISATPTEGQFPQEG